LGAQEISASIEEEEEEENEKAEKERRKEGEGKVSPHCKILDPSLSQIIY
jgi:hypothetical protein